MYPHSSGTCYPASHACGLHSTWSERCHRMVSPIFRKGGKRVARILIVEDELALRRVITLNLVRRGYTVAEADSVMTADDACALSAEPFDLILLDINLPDQTGWDVLRHLKQDP